MDILTHTISGMAVGTVMASFSNNGFTKQSIVIGMSGLAGALPDLDAISLWSGFDATLGKWFNLSETGREIYSGKHWYSHHGFMHSMMAALLFALVIGLITYFASGSRKGSFLNHLFTKRLLLSSFFLAYTLHLVEDMPTPASTWGGVRLLWPSETYYGGAGHIWWWNNYDIFLVATAATILNLTLLTINLFIKSNIWKTTITLFPMWVLLAYALITMRPNDFAYAGHTSQYQEFEQKSKDFQKELLGERLYGVMERFDNALPIYF